MNKLWKIVGTISVFLFVVLLSACSCNKDDDVDKVSLSIGDMNATTYREIDITDVDDMVDDDKTFLLYIFDPYCGTCNGFKPKLESVITEKNLIIYGVEAVKIGDKHALRNLKEGPSLVLYEDGEIVFKTTYGDEPQYFDTKEGFESFLDKYINLPTMYYISLEQLDSKIENDESFIIYYSRNTCPDCTYLNTHFLKEFLANNPSSKHFYVIETNAEGIRLKNGQTDSIQWQAFKDKYGLSNSNNSLGHGVGYVPTLQYYEDGEIKDMMVYFNDYEANNDYTEYTITSETSYYDDNPYIGQTLNSSEYQGKLASFYNGKLQTFLDTNLPKVD